MIYKCTNGFVIFTFEAIQEMEMLQNILPIPNLVPYSDKPLTFIPAAQALSRYLIAGSPINPLVTPIKSCADIIQGFKENRLTYSFREDKIVLRDTIMDKVELSTNRFGLKISNFTLQPYALVGYEGRATDFEAVFNAATGGYTFSYIRFSYE